MRTYDSYEARDEFNKIKRLVKSYSDSSIPDFMHYGKEDMLYCIDTELDRMEKFLTMYRDLRDKIEQQNEEI